MVSGAATCHGRRPFLLLFGAAVGGALLGRYLHWEGWLVAVASLLTAAPVLIAKRPRRLQILLLGAVTLLVSGRYAVLGPDSPGAGWVRSLEGQRLAVVRGEVVSHPEQSEMGASFLLKVGSVGAERFEGSGMRVRVLWPGRAPGRGDIVSIRGLLAAISGPRNPGEPDQRAYWSRQGVFLELRAARAADCSVISAAGVVNPWSWLSALRHFAEQSLSKDLDPRTAAAVLAMTLGETNRLTTEDKEAFRRTGTIHLFSVSGMHVGMVGGILWLALSLLRLPRPLIAVLTMLGIGIYVLVTGARPPSVRAAMMACIFLGGLVLARPPAALNSLFAAGTVILMLNPAELFNPGFQFSFAVVLALILFAGPVADRLESRFGVDSFLPRSIWNRGDRFRHMVVRWFFPLVSVSLVAWVASSVLTVIHFGMVPLYAAPVNLMAVPMAFGVVACSALSLLTAALQLGFLSVLANNTNWLITSALLALVHGASSLPGSVWRLPENPGPGIRAEITVLDVGAGSAILIRTREYRVLLDCGSERFFRSRVTPFLRLKGMGSLDLLIMSHGDADHIGGGPGLIGMMPVGGIVETSLPDRSPTRRHLQELARDMEIPVRQVARGDSLHLGSGVFLSILAPGAQPAGALADDRCFVGELHCGSFRMLFLMDSGLSLWSESLDAGTRPDIVYLGHHSEGLAPGLRLLRELGPEVAICTDAPFPETESLDPDLEPGLRASGIHLLSNSRHGAVRVSVGDDGVVVVPLLGDPLQLKAE